MASNPTGGSAFSNQAMGLRWQGTDWPDRPPPDPATGGGATSMAASKVQHRFGCGGRHVIGLNRRSWVGADMPAHCCRPAVRRGQSTSGGYRVQRMCAFDHSGRWIRRHLIGSCWSAAVIHSFESLGRSSAIAFPPFANVDGGPRDRIVRFGRALAKGHIQYTPTAPGGRCLKRRCTQ